MEFTAIAWNLYHGRDFPPDPALRSWRARLLRIDERNATHVQVNRDLTAEFATVLASAADLMASGEGGSNLTLVRVPGRLGGIAERREATIHEGAPERRTMALTRTASGICIANLHATNDRPDLASEDVLHAARAANEFAGEAPLLFGGDLNLRPAETPAVFERLREDFGLTGPTAPDAIDHLLVRGLGVPEPAVAWPPERRELPLDGRALRLSDHAPVEARLEAAEPPMLIT